MKTAECDINVSHYYGSDKRAVCAKFIIINLDINVLYHGLGLTPRLPFHPAAPGHVSGFASGGFLAAPQGWMCGYATAQV